MKPEINIIAAVCSNGAIGRNGDLLFHISEDLRRFKSLTLGYPIIMGRKTFESFPKGPLPGRRNVVISRNADYHPEGTEVFSSPEAALEACSEAPKVFIIGGGEIYRRFLPMADRLELTEIDAAPTDADTFFPTHNFTLESASEWVEAIPRYRFVSYKR
ncbi:MAG: dihydrofolate reductase [Bacteroides sp.]|nr:dihydrofolate reductase [Bacteroides sp.]MCM1380167.1 dihydrofolate reductase [Bacteroides sp.]MCM1446484.1 dihydrofolate reductase [Prevotella sp.]